MVQLRGPWGGPPATISFGPPPTPDTMRAFLGPMAPALHMGPVPMETALSGPSLPAAVPSADLSPQDYPAAPAEVPTAARDPIPAPTVEDVEDEDAPATVDPIPEPVEPVAPAVEIGDMRCTTCHRSLPLTSFVGVNGRRTMSTCNQCCVWAYSLLSTSIAADPF
jgi:hypothetical protein